MACSTPVIGADVGGIRYSVADGQTGLLVPPKDPAALAKALTLLKSSPDLARTMGEAGLARAREMFTWDGVADALASVYARVSGITANEEEIASLRAVGSASA
jgi:glycosyltransferase involved in cell wall biosynthesis